MVGKQNKEVSLLKMHGYGELRLSHLWQWSYLIMFFQWGRFFEAWGEEIPKKPQRNSKRSWDFWIWDCWIFYQKWKWTYDCAPGSGILCSWIIKGFVHHFTTRHSLIRCRKGYLRSSFSWWAWWLCGAQFEGRKARLAEGQTCLEGLRQVWPKE